MGKAAERVQALADDSHTLATVIDAYLDKHTDHLDGAGALLKADLIRCAEGCHAVAEGAASGGRGSSDGDPSPAAPRLTLVPTGDAS